MDFKRFVKIFLALSSSQQLKKEIKRFKKNNKIMATRG